MNLTIEQLAPLHLKERLTINASDIWLNSFSTVSPEYIFVQAPSGTGKTTLIHCLYGLRSDFEGSILWDKNEIRNFSNEKLADLRSKDLSIVFQDMRLFPEITAWENLEIKRSNTDTISEVEVLTWMNQLGISDKKNSLTKTLSYGEQQRLSIIRALLQPFSFLLMDEPFSHLDQDNIKIAADLIFQIVQKNKASLLLADLDQNNFFPYNKILKL
jgi:putative ABC transport system ATP-binding protein